MTDTERLAVRIAALENVTTATLALYLANSLNDPDLSKAKALLDALTSDGQDGLAKFPELVRQEGIAYLSALLNRVLQMIPALRGDDCAKPN